MTASASLSASHDAADPEHRIAVAAHEIRTPLGGMLALADLLLAEELNEAARGHASALKSAAEHLLAVSTALLGETAAAPRREEIDLDDFLACASAPLAARAAAKGLGFRAARGPGVPDRVIADAGALRQIVENLADNALRATTEGAVELAIERVSGDAGSVMLKVAVRDTGPGLGPEPQRLFAPYVQGERAPGAVGLGLALVARMAADMGGSAAAENLAIGGAEVSVTLRAAAAPSSGRPSGALNHVLVAEDNEINRRVLATLLDHFGRTYDMVCDGEAAVEAAAGGAYGLVLMDAVMPKLDGLSATRAIRALPGSAGAVRVVGVTARAYSHEIKAFIAAGADAVVVKPISVSELWRAIGADERRWAG